MPTTGPTHPASPSPALADPADPLAPPPVCSSDQYWTAARLIVAFTMALVIVTNVLMLVVTWRAASTRINAYFFVSLAMSDLLTGLFVLPFHLSFAARGRHGLSGSEAPGEAACTFSGVMFHVLQTISLFSFFALSLDRLLSIAYPLKYSSVLTRKMNVASLVVVWAVPAAMYGALPASGLGLYVYKCWQSMCNLGPVDPTYLTVMMLLSVTVFLATYLINGIIFYIAHRQRVRLAAMEQQFQASTGQKLRMGDRMKAAKAIVLALGLFTLCWGPYYTALFSAVLFNAVTTPLSEFSLLWVAISNSYMNFFVFLSTYRSFRTHFLRMLGVRDRRVDQASVTIISSN